MIHKLSELMSYMLYESNQAEVLLDQEVEYIRNYIALEKIRYGERAEISFNVYNNQNDLLVAPLLLLPFVENSFKHGVRNQLDNDWISIELDIVDDEIVFKVENSKVNKPTAKQAGIGLGNVMKRLDCLYPDSHSLTIFDEPDTYMDMVASSANVFWTKLQRLWAKNLWPSAFHYWRGNAKFTPDMNFLYLLRACTT